MIGTNAKPTKPKLGVEKAQNRHELHGCARILKHRGMQGLGSFGKKARQTQTHRGRKVENLKIKSRNSEIRDRKQATEGAEAAKGGGTGPQTTRPPAP